MRLGPSLEPNDNVNVWLLYICTQVSILQSAVIPPVCVHISLYQNQAVTMAMIRLCVERYPPGQYRNQITSNFSLLVCHKSNPVPKLKHRLLT